MSTRSVVRDEFETPVCTVIGLAPAILPAGRKVFSGAVRLEFGPLSVVMTDKTATEFAIQMLNAVSIAQGVAKVAA